jgi:hypothetical protein
VSSAATSWRSWTGNQPTWWSSHEEELLQRAADALGQLPVRGLLTTGPAVDPATIRAAANVSARRMAVTLAAERDEGLVVDELEQTALRGTAMSHRSDGTSSTRTPRWPARPSPSGSAPGTS